MLPTARVSALCLTAANETISSGNEVAIAVNNVPTKLSLNAVPADD